MWSFRLFQGCVFYRQYLDTMYTWWLIPLSKWVITPIINGISRVNPLITGVPTIHSTWINGDLFIQYLQLSIVGSTVIHDRPI